MLAFILFLVIVAIVVAFCSALGGCGGANAAAPVIADQRFR